MQLVFRNLPGSNLESVHLSVTGYRPVKIYSSISEIGSPSNRQILKTFTNNSFSKEHWLFVFVKNSLQVPEIAAFMYCIKQAWPVTLPTKSTMAVVFLWHFLNFSDQVFNKAPLRSCFCNTFNSGRPMVFCKKGIFWKNCIIHSKKPVPESLFKLETPAQMFSCEFYETFKNTVFIEHPQTTSSMLLSACFNILR